MEIPIPVFLACRVRGRELKCERQQAENKKQRGWRMANGGKLKLTPVRTGPSLGRDPLTKPSSHGRAPGSSSMGGFEGLRMGVVGYQWLSCMDWCALAWGPKSQGFHSSLLFPPSHHACRGSVGLREYEICLLKIRQLDCCGVLDHCRITLPIMRRERRKVHTLVAIPVHDGTNELPPHQARSALISPVLWFLLCPLSRWGPEHPEAQSSQSIFLARP